METYSRCRELMFGDEDSRLDSEFGGMGEGGLVFLAWVALVLASLLCLNECDALAVRIMVVPFVWGRMPEGGLEVRDFVSIIASCVLLGGLVFHVGYFAWSIIGAWRWRRVIRKVESALSQGNPGLARKQCTQGPPLLRESLENEESFPVTRTGRELMWTVFFLFLLVVPAPLEFVGSLSARNAAPSLGYHGTCLAVSALLVLPTAVNLALTWSLGSRRRFTVWSLVERIRAANLDS